MENKTTVEWKDVLVASGSALAAIAIISRWMGWWIEARIKSSLDDPETGSIALLSKKVDDVRADLQRLELETVKVSTWLEMNKARLAALDGAHHNSPFEIDVEWLGGLIESHNYTPDPVMIAEFRRIVADPETPTDDAALWSVIELRFGMEALAQEVMRFGAPGDTAPAIWILCIRKAQEMGADQFLREIKVIRE